MVRFIGLEVYEQTGDEVRRDLFADDHNGIFLTDSALLDTLARDKLAPLAERIWLSAQRSRVTRSTRP